jgi:hypothetical protein
MLFVLSIPNLSSAVISSNLCAFVVVPATFFHIFLSCYPKSADCPQEHELYQHVPFVWSTGKAVSRVSLCPGKAGVFPHFVALHSLEKPSISDLPTQTEGGAKGKRNDMEGFVPVWVLKT